MFGSVNETPEGAPSVFPGGESSEQLEAAVSEGGTQAQEHPTRCVVDGRMSCLSPNQLEALGEDREGENGPWPSGTSPR